MTTYVPNFGLASENLNYLMLEFISPLLLSSLPLLDVQIDMLANTSDNLLDWDTISSRKLPGWLFVKHKDKINWDIFLKNKKPKHLCYLIEVKDKILSHSYVFFENDIKKLYYSIEFIAAFPEIIDWNYSIEHCKLTDYLLLKYWDRCNIDRVCTFQDLSIDVLKEKQYTLNWHILSKRHLSESIIDKFCNLVDWDLIGQYQKLSEHFIIQHKNKLNPSILCTYQVLSEDFINKYILWLPMLLISKYQNLSAEFISDHRDELDFTLLSQNINYNKEHGIQILQSGGRWYIIMVDIISPSGKINFCTLSLV